MTGTSRRAEPGMLFLAIAYLVPTAILLELFHRALRRDEGEGPPRTVLEG